MAATTCPSCDTPLTIKEYSTGRCPVCKAALRVRFEGYVDAVSSGMPVEGVVPVGAGRAHASWARGAASGKVKLTILIAGGGVLVLLLLVGLFLFLFLWPDVTIWVDNGGTETLTIHIDGEVKATVAAGTAAKISCRSGTRKIQVAAEGRTVYDHTRHVQSGKYLLNPAMTNRYHVWTAEYSQFGIPRFEMYFDEKDRFHKEAARIVLVEPAEWMTADYDHVLEAPPKQVKTDGSLRRTVISRIAKADWEVIAAAKQNANPSDEDMRRLSEAVRRVEAVDRP